MMANVEIGFVYNPMRKVASICSEKNLIFPETEYQHSNGQSVKK